MFLSGDISAPSSFNSCFSLNLLCLAQSSSGLADIFCPVLNCWLFIPVSGLSFQSTRRRTSLDIYGLVSVGSLLPLCFYYYNLWHKSVKSEMGSLCRWGKAEHETEQLSMGWAAEWKPSTRAVPGNFPRPLHWCEPDPASSVLNFFCLELTWAGKIRIQMLVFLGGFLRKGKWWWLSHKPFISDSFNSGNKQGIESSWASLGLFPCILFLSAEMQIRSTLLKLGRYFIIYFSNWWEISETRVSKSICCY